MKILKKTSLEDILFLDIETSTVVPELQLDTPLFRSWAYKSQNAGKSNDEIIASFKKEAALYADFGRIVCISVGRLFNGEFVTTTFNDFDEGAMIKEFYKTLDKEDWLLCGHAIKSFDLPYIFQRSIINGIPPHELVDVSGEKPWTITWMIDTKELWSGSSFNKSSLVNITTALGLPSPKEGIVGSQVPAYFWENPEGHIKEISEYCERDVAAVYQVMKRFKNPDEKPAEESPLIIKLFEGAKYTPAYQKALEGFIMALKPEEKERVFLILDALVSTANGKKTHFTKANCKKLKEICL